MSSHIHLGVVAGNAPLVDWLAPMHSDFARWINERLDRIGGVFVRGPDVVEFRPEGTPALIDYIHNNPVRAGVVAHPRDSDWSSHQAYCGLANKPRWLDIELGLQLSGFRDGKELEAWMEVKRTRREELDTFRVTPRRPRGRPSKREELHDRLLSASAENDESTESSVESKVDKAA